MILVVPCDMISIEESSFVDLVGRREGKKDTWSSLQLNSKQLLPPWRQTLTGLEIFMIHSRRLYVAGLYR